MALNKASHSHYSMKHEKNIPIDFPRILSLNNDENFKLIITLIANEFESKKDIFKNFKTEREFLSSHDLKDFILDIKQYIVCWRIRPQDLGWLDEYLKSLLVEHWRSLSKEPKPMELIEDQIEDQGPIPIENEVKPIAIEPNLQYEVKSQCKLESSPFHTRIGLSLEQANFRLIWTDLNEKKTLEIPSTLCLVDARAIPTQAQSYSWKLFNGAFQKLMNDENCNPVQLDQGCIKYAHPENSMRVIKNQIQFWVSLNHMVCNLQGCVGEFFYCGSSEVGIGSTKENQTDKVYHSATHSGRNKYPLKVSSSSSHISMLRRKTLKARRLKAVRENPRSSRSGLYRSISKATAGGIRPSQKLGRSFK